MFYELRLWKNEGLGGEGWGVGFINFGFRWLWGFRGIFESS